MVFPSKWQPDALARSESTPVFPRLCVGFPKACNFKATHGYLLSRLCREKLASKRVENQQSLDSWHEFCLDPYDNRMREGIGAAKTGVKHAFKTGTAMKTEDELRPIIEKIASDN